jgi:hypothetical protein
MDSINELAGKSFAGDAHLLLWAAGVLAALFISLLFYDVLKQRARRRRRERRQQRRIDQIAAGPR